MAWARLPRFKLGPASPATLAFLDSSPSDTSATASPLESRGPDSRLPERTGPDTAGTSSYYEALTGHSRHGRDEHIAGGEVFDTFDGLDESTEAGADEVTVADEDMPSGGDGSATVQPHAPDSGSIGGSRSDASMTSRVVTSSDESKATEEPTAAAAAVHRRIIGVRDPTAVFDEDYPPTAEDMEDLERQAFFAARRMEDYDGAYGDAYDPDYHGEDGGEGYDEGYDDGYDEGYDEGYGYDGAYDDPSHPDYQDPIDYVIPDGELSGKVQYDKVHGVKFETAYYKVMDRERGCVLLRQRYALDRVIAFTLQGYTCLADDKSGNNNEVVAKVAYKKLMESGKALSDTSVPEDFEKEIAIMRKLSESPHIGICQYIDDWETPSQRYLTMEYCDSGDLFEYTKKKLHGLFPSPPLTNGDREYTAAQVDEFDKLMHAVGGIEAMKTRPQFVPYERYKRIRMLFAQLVDGAHYLYKNNVSHLDLSLENVLCRSRYRKFGLDMHDVTHFWNYETDSYYDASDELPGVAGVPPRTWEDLRSPPAKPRRSPHRSGRPVPDSTHSPKHNDGSRHDPTVYRVEWRRDAIDRLYDEEPILRIIDFGVAIEKGEEMKQFKEQLRREGDPMADDDERLKSYVLRHDQCVGKTKYQAPEVYDCRYPTLRKRYKTDKADIWCLGVMLFMMIFLRHPYAKPSRRSDSEFKSLVSVPSELGGGGVAKWIMIHRFERWICPMAFDLLSKIFRLDPDDRITMEELIRHPFVSVELTRQRCRRYMEMEREAHESAVRLAAEAEWEARQVALSRAHSDSTEYDSCMSPSVSRTRPRATSRSESISFSAMETPVPSSMGMGGSLRGVREDGAEHGGEDSAARESEHERDERESQQETAARSRLSVFAPEFKL